MPYIFVSRYYLNPFVPSSTRVDLQVLFSHDQRLVFVAYHVWLYYGFIRAGVGKLHLQQDKLRQEYLNLNTYCSTES